MGSKSRRGGKLGRRVPALVATLLSVGLLYLVVRVTLGSLSPVAGAQLPPREYSKLLRLHVQRILIPGQRVSPDVLNLAREAALAEPLAFEPFFVAARAADQAGRLQNAIALMEEARRRRRNFAPTRLELATYYTRSGRLAAALHELEVVIALRPTLTEPVMGELAKLLPSAEGRRVLADVLSRGPTWRDQFFTIARNRSVRPEDALALVNELRARRPNADLSRARQLYVTALANAGRLREARRIWIETLPPAEQARNRLISNSGFAGPRAPEPFGWQVRSEDVGRAEIVTRGTPAPFLQADYFGGSNALLAEQLIALPPGRYRLRYQVSGEVGSGNSRLYWSVSCFSGAPELARSEIGRVGAAPRPMEAAFTVPAAGCDGQRLRLIGEAGDVPTTMNLRIAGLDILQ